MITVFTWKQKNVTRYQVFPVAYTYDTTYGGQLKTGETGNFATMATYGYDTNYKDQLRNETSSDFSAMTTYKAG